MRGFFSYTGRMGRGRYFWTMLLLEVLWLLSASVLELLVMELGGGLDTAPLLFWFLASPLAFLAMSFPIVKRFHDLDRPGKQYYLLLIPLYNLYLFLVLLFKKGTPGENQYGTDPQSAGKSQPS